MNTFSRLKRSALLIMPLSLLLVVALLIGSLFLGPSNPNALPITQLKISELMVNNVSALQDEDGNFYSWAEITNFGSISVDLTGLTLSDDPNRPDRFVFPNRALTPGESLVVYFTGNKSETRAYHTTFGLKNDGDSLYLFSGDTLLDSLKSPSGPEDRSIGLSDKETVWFATTTPGKPNGGITAKTLDALSDKLFTGILINEVCTVSDKKTDNFADWVELFNTTDHAIDLSGYRLTEDLTVDGLTFHDVIIEPHSYLVVYCDKDGVADINALCAPFSLNRNGDTIYLVTPNGLTADSFSSGKQRNGITSGRQQGDRRFRYFFETPTPGEENTAGVDGYAVVPVIHQVGGYAEKNSEITISVPEGCQVFYSTDGSEPTSKSKLYTEGAVISLKSTSVIRAVALKEGYLPSDVVTQTYVIGTTHQIPIISVSADPDALFGKNGVWKNYLKENYQTSVHTEYFTADGTKEVEFDSIFRIAGGLTRYNIQKAFSLNLHQTVGDSEITYPFFSDTDRTTFGNLLLRPSGSDWNQAKLRDEFTARALKNTEGQLIQSAQPVALYINGQYYGLYYLREKRNEEFISDYTGIPPEYVQIAQQPGLSDYKNKLDPDMQAVIDYAKKHDLRKQEHYDYILSQIDALSLMRYYVIQTFFGNGDNINNITTYRDTRGGKWKWIVFDMDWACTSYYASRNFLSQLKTSVGGAYYQNYYYPLITALLKNEEFRTQFLQTYAEMLETTLSAERLVPILDTLASEIEAEIPLQYKKYSAPSTARWNNQINYIRKFLQGREATMVKQLKSTFSLTTAEWEAFKPQ